MFKTRINGDLWTVMLVSADKIREMYGGDTVSAYTSPSEKLLVFSEEEDELIIENVRHELFHAYASYLYLEDSNEISYDDYEEIFASWFADRGPIVLRQATFLLNKLRELRDVRKESGRKKRSKGN